MATVTQTTPSPASRKEQRDGYEQYIENQLDRTGTQVKMNDLFGASMLLLAGVLSFFLAVAIVDHWVWGLGTAGRWLALATILAGAAYYIVRVILPLFVGRINPVFAARAIERAEPRLNNSLVNFLMFREDRAGLRAAVYQAIEQQAATDLSHVEVETAVDRTRLLRIGYLLTTVVVICGLYTVFSPKSPFQSLARVVAPWADVEVPSRVRIEQVLPGNARIYQGENLRVRVECYDIGENEPVNLYFSTVDGHLTNQKLVMQAAESGLVFDCEMSGDGNGLQRDLVYWIEAGDARSSVYRVDVIPAPAIFVDRISYAFPTYTARADRSEERQGDIKALEGTKVTVDATANQPIQSAVIELLSDTQASPRLVEMNADGQSASGSFVLEMADDRSGAKFTQYQLRFTTESGDRNEQPVVHEIMVLPDLPPEVQVLSPRSDRIEVPQNGMTRIEIRGLDPDFGLSEIRLRAVRGGDNLLDEKLLDDRAGRPGQAIVSYDFRPAKFGLSAGDVVTFWATVADNRTSASDGQPAPNRTKTREYQITVVLPMEGPAKPPEDKEPREQQQPEDSSQNAEKPNPNSSGDQPAGGDSDNGGQQDDQQGDKGESAEGDGTGKGDQSGGESGDEQQGNKQSQSGGQSSDSSDSDNSSDDSHSESGTGQGQSTGKPGDQDQASSANSGDQSSGSQSGGEPLHDGEVFERALEHLKKQQQDGGENGQNADGQGASQSQTSDNPSQPGDNTNTPQPPSGPRGAAEQSRPEQNGGDDTKPSDNPADAMEPGDTAAAESPTSPQSKQNAGSKPGQKNGIDKSQGAGGTKKDAASGEGGKSEGPAESKQEPQSKQSPGAEKEPGAGDNGESGKGQDSQDPSGSAQAEEANKDRQKSSDGDQSQSKPGSEPQSPSQSKKQSDSKGGEGGDRSGGGKKGAGQGANQPGNDSAGSNSPSDDGAGAAEESGTGDTASGGGDKQQGEDPTNTPGAQKGMGSSTRPNPDGNSSGASPKSPKPGEPRQQKGDNPGGESRKGGKGTPLGGGTPRPDELNGFEITGEVPPGEKPNLDYARKATDLALEHLKDQQQNPDADLLNELGWTKDDLKRFIQRWESLKRSAKEDAARTRELDESLRSLGLRPNNSRTRKTAAPDDSFRDVRDAGFRSSPPAGYSDLYDAYRKGTARRP